MLRFVIDYALYVHLSYKDDDLFRNGSIHESDYAWKPAKWAKFMLVLTRLQISQYEFVLQKHCDYRLEKQTIMLRSVPQMLKKWRIVVNKISKGEENNMQLNKEDTRRSN